MIDFLSAIGTALTAGGTGGLLGIIGSAASAWMKTRAAAVELERERMLFEQKIKLMEFQASTAAGERDMAALTAAVRAEGRTNEKVSPWVADVKSLWRPALTLLLLFLTAWIFYAVAEGDLVLQGTTREEILTRISSGIIFLANLAVAFWYGSRGAAPDRVSKQ